MCTHQYRNVTALYGVTSYLRGLLKVKLSLYRPGQAQGVSKRLRLPVSRKSAYEGGKVVSPIHRPPLPLVLISDIS